MSKPWVFCIAGLLVWSVGLYAQRQENRQEELPAPIRERAIVLQITTKVEQSNKKVWTVSNSKATIPGRPVNIKLVGENIVIEIQFTPFLRRGKYTLVAQSQIWIDIPEKGVNYKTVSQSMDIDFKEPIVILPLGSDPASDNPHIELNLTMYRYGEEPTPADPIPEPEKAPAGKDH
jgi:hypothetical protein